MPAASELIAGAIGAAIGWLLRHLHTRHVDVRLTIIEPDDDETPATGLPRP